jgi:putative ABC transport system ATP-binding protein
MSQLRFENVHKIYKGPQGGVHALRGVSLQVERGEFVAFCGPSGCGKSTLLHLAGAMDVPTSGQVWLAGQRIDQQNRRQLALLRRRLVGFVFQSFHLLPTLTALENAVLPLLLNGHAVSAAVEEAKRLLRWAGLGERLHHYPGQLSGGELQRVAIVRAVITRPELLIADEPTGSLDTAQGHRILELLAAWNREHKLTILLATHSHEAAAYSHRILRMRDGLIESLDIHESVTPN